jgi:3-dehydroquinate synthase
VRDSVVFCGIKDIAARINLKRTLVVTDKKVHALFTTSFPDCPLVYVPEGEAAKSWDILADLYRHFIALKLDRSWSILAIGGGTISDIAGFAAHTWMRGIDFLAAPTTLLAMTDAALGGKNGIDFQGYKNVVGSFHLPKAIFCDIETLKHLDADQFASGMAEVVKHAIIDGEVYFSLLERYLASFGAPDGFAYATCPSSVLEQIVSESQRIKLDIVERDPRESGERRLLNLGHTFGHAIEVLAGIPHGHSISLGIALASSFSVLKGTMEAGTAERIAALLAGFSLPVDFKRFAAGDFFERVGETLFMDKKRDGAFMNLVVPRNIGLVTVEKIPVDELKAFLREVAV